VFQVPIAQAKGAAPCEATGQHQFQATENTGCVLGSLRGVSRPGPRRLGLRKEAARSAADPAPTCVSAWRLFGVSGRRVVLAGRRTCAAGMLAQWFSSTRLETRTKESNTYASSKVANLGCAMKVTLAGSRKGAPSTDHPSGEV
jgi:hypothetical protein